MSIKERIRSELPRPTTWFLALIFLLALVLYILVRPVEPAPTGTPVTLVPAPTATPKPKVAPSPARSSRAPGTRAPSHTPSPTGSHTPSAASTPTASAAVTPVEPSGRASATVAASPSLVPTAGASPTP